MAEFSSENDSSSNCEDCKEFDLKTETETETSSLLSCNCNLKK